MSQASSSRRVTLSTGHEIDLPLELSFAVGGVIAPARRRRLEDLLPDALSALALAPGVGCVALAGIQYHRVGGRDAAGLVPYDEFAVVVPAVRGSRTALPGLQAIDGEIGGYVHWLPVTTAPSVALGRECWGYPKERLPITVTDGPRGIRTVVDGADGDERIRLEVPRPRTDLTRREIDRSLWSYTTTDGDLLRTRARFRGQVALGSPAGATVDLEPVLRRELGCWSRPLVRVYGFRVQARLYEGEPVADG